MNLEKLAAACGQELKRRKLTLVTAESCTAGGVSFWVTSIAGSSEWFERGFVTYSNQAKIDMLGVDANIISSFGAVSEQTACAMAEGALLHSRAEVSLAVTGIAGPDGGSAEKPAGTVWIAWAKRQAMPYATLEHFSGTRAAVRLATIKRALEGLAAFLTTK